MATILVQSQNYMIFGEEATPAHYYSGSADFSIVLDDIAKGTIPVNTREPFPVVWRSDAKNMDTPPWQSGNDNPWR